MINFQSVQNINIIQQEQQIIFQPVQDISQDSLIGFLKELYQYQNTEDCQKKCFLDLKHLPVQLKSAAVKFSLSYTDLKDSIMILNIINLIKIYNTLQDEFFQNEHIYMNSIEQMLDIKLAIKPELKSFIKQLSIYFISLLKTYNKTNFTPMDQHIDLPKIYKIILLSLDMLTLSGIFSVSQSFNTSECVYIDNAVQYISILLNKSRLCIDIMDSYSL